ncbi:MAG: DUF1570 domain-containing protein, partial [bacterium]|nr:DUF1570 domain-containing protein [bacterium]
EPVVPENKLEIYFFANHEHYKSYGSTVGGIPDWAAGFYMRTINRSAFYDMNYEPSVVQIKRQFERANWRAKQFVRNRLKRRMDFFNINVTQHEAAHHIHFNTGVFPKRGDMPRWVTEGLAQMFELPPGKLGGSLGATNHYRLAEFQTQYNRRYGGNPRALVKLRHFISDDSTWNPQAHYPYGWALNHYLWQKQRDKYAVFMRRMSKREEDKRLPATEQQPGVEALLPPARDGP